MAVETLLQYAEKCVSPLRYRIYLRGDSQYDLNISTTLLNKPKNISEDINKNNVKLVMI